MASACCRPLASAAPRLLFLRTGQRCFSSNPPPPPPAKPSSSSSSSSNKQEDPRAVAALDSNNNSTTQPFVQARFRPGEWDPDTRTNPLYRPKYRSRAKILHQDDFAKQPTVGFSGEFESFQDAMVTLSWLDQADQKQIYQLYLDLMQHGQQKHGKTSHEYVMRVIAQKYNITEQRVAGIVQLQHNEEQMKQDPDKYHLLEEAADYMDNAIKQEILEAYKTFGLKKPDDFVEDPVGITGLQESKAYQVVEDLLDVDQITQDTILREEREARLAIDGHVYVEDVDDEDIKIPLDKDCRQLLHAQGKFAQQQQHQQTSEVLSDSITPLPESGERRERWKFVAQVVNTRQLKKKRQKSRSYTNNSPANTLVEHNGQLRAATMADVKQTAWKPIRHVQEHTYQGAKRGWLDRQLRGDLTAWGKAKKTSPAAPKTMNREQETKEASKESSIKTANEDDEDAETPPTTDNESSSDEDEGSDTSEESGSDSSSSDEENDSEMEDEEEKDKD